MGLISRKIWSISILSSLSFLNINTAVAVKPTQEDVNVYSSLCRTGSLSKYDLSAEGGLISRRLLSGSAKLSAQEIEDQFPQIKDEKNRVLLIQNFQDCIYRYVARFHPPIEKDVSSDIKDSPQLAPSIPPERRREIIFLANQIEDFKKAMEKAKKNIPSRYYNPNDSTEYFPREDTRLIDLENYNKYKAFQASDGVPDFSNVTKNDVKIMCSTFLSEVKAYNDFRYNWQNAAPTLTEYRTQGELNRICEAAGR